ncbi:hypothetical protein F9C11_02205 [Amycolatopsis sp. VS8301801F10]|uniref:hypothetical protein n=1 Tax=Amycolatopsis sp. VS8301801F10 TaxID=2652442 RepID=UPI0038FC57FB
MAARSPRSFSVRRLFVTEESWIPAREPGLRAYYRDYLVRAGMAADEVARLRSRLSR